MAHAKDRKANSRFQSGSETSTGIEGGEAVSVGGVRMSAPGRIPWTPRKRLAGRDSVIRIGFVEIAASDACLNFPRRQFAPLRHCRRSKPLEHRLSHAALHRIQVVEEIVFHARALPAFPMIRYA